MLCCQAVSCGAFIWYHHIQTPLRMQLGCRQDVKHMCRVHINKSAEVCVCVCYSVMNTFISVCVREAAGMSQSPGSVTLHNHYNPTEKSALIKRETPP